MLLRSLRLKNIRSYIDETIDFSEGTTLLTGDIGAGKTTILLAIEFAFFGLLKGDISGATLLRHGAAEGIVELSCTINDVPLVIARRLKRKNTTVAQDSGYLILHDTKTELTPVELKSKIIELFGYPQDLLTRNPSIIYRYTVYTPQEEMKTILYESPEERMDILRKIFNIDRYKRIRENALAYAKELRNQRKALESTITDLGAQEAMHADKSARQEDMQAGITRAAAQLEDQKRRAKGDEEKLAAVTQGMDGLRALRQQYDIALLNLRNAQSESDRLQKESNMNDFRIADYTKRIAELGSVDINEEDIRNELSAAEEKLTKVTSAKETITSRIASKMDDLKNIIIESSATLASRHGTLTKKLEGKEQAIQTLDQMTREHTALQLERAGLLTAQTSAQKIIDQIKDLSTCPVCLQTVDFAHKVKITDREGSSISDATRRLAEIERKIESLAKTIAAQRKLIDALHEDELELAEINHRIGTLNEKITQKTALEKEIEELREKQQKLDAMPVDKLIDLISKHRKILGSFQLRRHLQESLQEKGAQQKELAARLTSITATLAALSAEKIHLEESIAAESHLEEEYLAAKRACDESTRNVNTLALSLLAQQKDCEALQIELSHIAEEIARKRSAKAKIAYMGELNHWITEQFVGIVATIEKAIMQKIHLEFDELFQTWFEMLLDDENITITIDEEFTPVITQNNYTTALENLSGGEKTAVALAYRLALNKAINDFITTITTKDLLILDEPTDGFSSEQLDKMKEVLTEMRCRQLLIVSHEAKMESYAEHIIRINKHEHISSKL